MDIVFIVWLMMSCLVTVIASGSMAPSPQGQPSVLQYLQSESSALSSMQQAVQAFLQSKKIPVGGIPRSLRKDEKAGAPKVRIALSTKSNNLECRIALGRAPIGRKCVSPCGCTGSQQWIQFSELNRLRRKEPAQWTKCQTCQQPFDYSVIATHGGVSGNAISLLLDNVNYVRISLLVLTCVGGYVVSANMLLMRFLTSRFFWQQYPKWVKIMNLPLVLKFWGGKIVGQYLWAVYLQGESRLMEMLSDLETTLIEPNLPAENAEQVANKGDPQFKTEEEEEEENDDEEEDGHDED